MRRGAIGRRAAAGAAYAEEQAPEAVDEVPAPEPTPDPVGRIKELAELREQGILTEEEFAAERKRLLGP